MYAVAASAVGAGMLGRSSTAEARIIYIPANVTIANGSPLAFSFGRSAEVEFTFGTAFSSFDGSSGVFQLSIRPANQKNRIWGTGGYASALQTGVMVGPNAKKFQVGHDLMGVRIWHCCDLKPQSSTSWGQWFKVQQGYLGLKFVFPDGAHYGWARLSLEYAWPGYVKLTGCAYETVPNKPIKTGKTKGPEVTADQPATLGRLALGRE
jgi:hypothetical protein